MAWLGMPDPDVYRTAIRAGGTAITYTVDATRGGTVLATGLQPVGGSITDTSRPGVRRKLDVNLAGGPDLYDLLGPVGVELAVTCHVRLTNRTVVDIPMGVYDVDGQSLDASTGAVSLTAPDKWGRIQRARFVTPASSVPGKPVVDQIGDLIRGALGTDEQVVITATSLAEVGALVWEKDRDKAITELAASIGAWVYFDRDGVATIADIPTAGSYAHWLVDASASGVLTELSRERSRNAAHNVVVVSSSASDGERFPVQIVWDDDHTSPTYAGPNPINSPELAGPFGIVPYYYDTPVASDANQARMAGRTILTRVTGLASSVSLGQVPNPAVDALDVIDVLPPGSRTVLTDAGRLTRVSTQRIERHIADTVSHSLSVGTAQRIEGRSTRAEEIEGGS